MNKTNRKSQDEESELINSPGETIVAVDGASGYVGNHVVEELRKKNIRVHCIVHPGIKDNDREYLKSTGAEIFQTDLKADSAILQSALQNVSCVIHLIGSIAPPKGQRLSDLHAGQTSQLIEACKKNCVPKIVMITALGTASDAASEYHRTKWESEELVRNSGIPFVILRPSLIIGRVVGSRNSKLIARFNKLIAERPQVPVIEGAKNLIQPVFVGDLAEAIAAAALALPQDPKFSKQTLEIGGNEVIPMNHLIRELMTQQNLSKPLKSLPAPIAGIAAFFLETFSPGVPLLSRDQVKLACIDNICTNNTLLSIFGVQPTSVAAALQTYDQSKSQHGAR